MKNVSWLLVWILCLNLPLLGQDQSSFSLFSFFKNDKSYQAADFLEPSSEYEIIRDKTDSLSSDLGKRNSLKICLKNGLEVYLISDPMVTQSAAALSVAAGSWNDPGNAPGMAHFVEHLLFMGTQKYPDEADFSKYIGERGGEYNASTCHDRTIYGFCLNHEGLEGALDRFSHFFIDPIFSPSTIQREKNAIHHEFEDHIENDTIKVWRVLKETGNPHHPNAVFSCGNLQSLSEVSQKEIKQWFSTHYGAPQMHLVVVSPLPLRELSQMVVKFFSEVPATEKQEYSYDFPFTSEKQRGHFIYLNPSYKKRSLQLIWEVPKEFAQEYNMRPMHLVQLALDHEGDLSLGKILQQDKLASEVALDYWRVEKDHVLFMLEVALTKKGVKQVEEVIYRCFQAISKLREEGIPYKLYEQLYNAEKQLSEYTSPQNTFDFVMDTAVALIDEELETYPQKMNLSSSYDSNFLNRFIDSLVPESCLFFLMAPHQETQVQMNAFEKWMGTPYTIRDIPKEKLSQWKMAPPHPNIEMGSFEHEIKEEFDNPWEDEEDLPESKPVVITPSAHIRLSYIEEPSKSSIAAFFCINNHLFKSSVKNAAMSSLFVNYLQERLDKIFPAQQKDSLSWILIPGESEIYVYLKVFDDNKAEKLQSFFSELCLISVDQRSFEETRLHFLDTYTGDPDPLEYAQSIVQSLLMPSYYTLADVHKVIPNLLYEEYQTFTREFFDKSYIEGIFYGNLTVEQVSEYWGMMETSMNKREAMPDRFTEEGNRRGFVRWDKPMLMEQETHRKGNALMLVLDIGTASRESWAIQKILSQILQEEFFDELRTKQQTAYRLYSWGETFQDKLLQYLAIQSSTHHSRDLLVRVEDFIENFGKNFHSTITRERVNLVRYMLITSFKRQKQAHTSSEESRGIATSIETLKSITYEKVCSVAEEAFARRNGKRLAVLVEGSSSYENEVPSLEALSSYSVIDR